MQINTVQQALDFIKSAGRAEDCPLNLFLGSLAFAKLFHVEAVVTDYLEHMEEMVHKLHTLYSENVTRSDEESLELQHHCLVQVMKDEFMYDGDHEDYNNPLNADMMSVIDRRRGLPVALGILYLHLAREMEWDVYGLNFPGHFLFALNHDGRTLFIDPFRDGRIVEAADMRQILKAIGGQQAELSHDYYKPLDDHDILLRLQNNLKSSLIENERYDDALKAVNAMRVFDPDEYRLLFDSAILKMKTGQVTSAGEDVRAYLDRATGALERSHGEQLLYEIERSLN